MRNSEKTRLSGQFYYMLGLAWAAFILPKTSAIQSVLILAWADPTAGFCGRKYGANKWETVIKKLFSIEKNDEKNEKF